MTKSAFYRFYLDRDGGVLCRQRVLDDHGRLLGLGQILRGEDWVYYFLDPHKVNDLTEEEAVEVAGGKDLNAQVAGLSGDHLDGRDESRWGEPGSGSGIALAGDMRDIEALAKQANRELTLDEATQCAEIRESLREKYDLAWEFSLGTPVPEQEVTGDLKRPKVQLAHTGGDFLKIGGTVEGTLKRAEDEGSVPPGTAAEFRREGMPRPLGEAPMVEYRDMLRHLLTTAARYVEIEDAYIEADGAPDTSR